MDIHRRSHDLRGYERVHRLLDDDGAEQGDQSDPRADEHAHKRRQGSAEPRAHDGDDVQNAGDNAECGVIGDAGDGEQHAACSTDDAALDERSLDIAAHDARERDVQHIHGLAMGRACQSHGLATERRKLDEDPKRYDQGETHRYARVHHAGADGDHARGALSRHIGRR